MEKHLILPDEGSTVALGERIGNACRGGETLLLTGELGAGKTTLVRGVARGLGITRGVRSPTFQLLREYHGRLTFYHADLYRFEPGGDPAAELGLDELPGPGGVLAVEWAERGISDVGGLAIELEFEGTGRRAVLTTTDAGHLHLLAGVEGWNV
ncbi:MAG: tRNA (adenosine(37)-N6)-threonylcarbamoyltransferase complex ATPase subunit type 1 TsaE [Candidatus Coatesbacteria bacterium RBG_13_66_14]|uniref:tRNA threonylcarbamoyladenosine biosynthesis protein TsaE n=1 Tax=Candidatus Coatesbacteria bacterium RBG_13_66_14 TaxID=1817816 RepID=A0A1F5FH24_9BACT|nr:MAG: tRNA (adenosine(37)-N6)-threonylcarbamoyltransferase complex ATPase subunit type 1 TsaE [Candidatus Coatesbacteria bacterium RBG_13_66_14]